MTWLNWLSVLSVCFVGAASPGPSLIVIGNIALKEGRIQGILSSLAHGVGVAIWAALTVYGLSYLLTNHQSVYKVMLVISALYLIYLALPMFKSTIFEFPKMDVVSHSPPRSKAILKGFFIGVSNPKLGIFFLAVFSQFVVNDLSQLEQMILIASAAVIDASWYCLVSVALSSGMISTKLMPRLQGVDRIMGVLLLGIAVFALYQASAQ